MRHKTRATIALRRAKVSFGQFPSIEFWVAGQFTVATTPYSRERIARVH